MCEHPGSESFSTISGFQTTKNGQYYRLYLLSFPVFQCNFIDLPQSSDVVDVLKAYYIKSDDFKSDDFGPEPSLTWTANIYLEFLMFTGQLNAFLLKSFNLLSYICFYTNSTPDLHGEYLLEHYQT